MIHIYFGAVAIYRFVTAKALRNSDNLKIIAPSKAKQARLIYEAAVEESDV